MPVESEEIFNEGASTSSAAQVAKDEKKKNVPWIEKYRPQKFEEIMGEKCFFILIITYLTLHFNVF